MTKFFLRFRSGLTGGNYADKLKRIVAQRDGDLHGVGSVLHDDWCGIFEGNACDCDPDIRFWERTDKDSL